MPKSSNNKEIFLKLLSIVSSDEIASLIKGDDFFQSGNCSNRNIYEYDEQDIDKIFSEIERKVKESKAKFHFPKKREFKL